MRYGLILLSLVGGFCAGVLYDSIDRDPPLPYLVNIAARSSTLLQEYNSFVTKNSSFEERLQCNELQNVLDIKFQVDYILTRSIFLSDEAKYLVDILNRNMEVLKDRLPDKDISKFNQYCMKSYM